MSKVNEKIFNTKGLTINVACNKTASHKMVVNLKGRLWSLNHSKEDLETDLALCANGGHEKNDLCASLLYRYRTGIFRPNDQEMLTQLRWPGYFYYGRGHTTDDSKIEKQLAVANARIWKRFRKRKMLSSKRELKELLQQPWPTDFSTMCKFVVSYAKLMGLSVMHRSDGRITVGICIAVSSDADISCANASVEISKRDNGFFVTVGHHLLPGLAFNRLLTPGNLPVLLDLIGSALFSSAYESYCKSKLRHDTFIEKTRVTERLKRKCPSIRLTVQEWENAFPSAYINDLIPGTQIQISRTNKEKLDTYLHRLIYDAIADISLKAKKHVEVKEMYESRPTAGSIGMQLW